MPAAPHPRFETARVAALRSLEILDSESETHFDRLAEIAALVCRTPIALISLIDTERQWFKARYGLPDVEETHRDLAFCAYTIHQSDILEVENALDDERFQDNALVLDEPHIRYYAGAPLVLSDGNRIGTLCVIDQRPGRINAEQRKILRSLAATVSRMMEQRRDLKLSVGEMTRALAAADVAHEARTQFLGAMSHELRTPLNAIIGFSEILKDELFGELPPRYLEPADLIHSSGVSLLALVNDLLELGRIETDTESFDRGLMDICSVVARVADSIAQRARERGVLIETHLPDALPIITDERAMRRIMMNMIESVVHVTKSDETVHVEVETAEESIWITVSVEREIERLADGGSVLVKDKLSPFVQSAFISDQKLPGTGLAVPIAGRLAALLGGDLRVWVGTEQDVTLRLTLPRNLDHEAYLV